MYFFIRIVWIMIHSVIRTISDVSNNNNEYSPAACSMQHAIFDLSDIPWILQRSSFSHSSFWREYFLNISNHLPVNWQRVLANLTKLSFWSLPTTPWMTQLSSFNQFGTKNEQIFQITPKFHRVKTCFCLLSTPSTLIQITHKFTFRFDHA